jgi:hypothetical protein
VVLNLNIKIKSGKRTPVEVSVYSTSVNQKTMEFVNGKSLTEKEIIEWLCGTMAKSLKAFETKEV